MANPTTNMGLALPVVSSTLGPDWATLLNAALDQIDSHNHTTGNGVKVPSAGININGDLSFANNSATSLKSVSLVSNAASIVDPRSIYSFSNNLWYTNGSGIPVQITDGNGIVGTPGSINGLVSPASASYNPGSLTFSWLSDAFNSTLAIMKVGSIELHASSISTNNKITLKAPNTLGSSFNVTLPSALPVFGSSQFMMLGSSGNIYFASGSGGTVQELSPGVVGLVPASAGSIDLYLNDQSVTSKKVLNQKWEMNNLFTQTFNTGGVEHVASTVNSVDVSSTSNKMKMGIMPVKLASLNIAATEQYIFVISNSGASTAIAWVAIKAVSPTAVSRYYAMRVYCDPGASTVVYPFEYSDTFNETGNWSFSLVIRLANSSMTATISHFKLFAMEF